MVHVGVTQDNGLQLIRVDGKFSHIVENTHTVIARIKQEGVLLSVAIYPDQQAKSVLSQEGIGGDFSPLRFRGPGDNFGILQQNVHKVIHECQDLHAVQFLQNNRFRLHNNSFMRNVKPLLEKYMIT